MQRVVHSGRETAYRLVEGETEGLTALYVHGSGADHRIWANQYSSRGPSHPAVALDLSGHGESEDVDTAAGPETLAAYAADIAAVAQETHPDVLIGHSLGGAVVFELLLESLYEPRGVVFAGTGAKLAVQDSLRQLLREDFESLVELLHRDSRLLYDADDELKRNSQSALLSAGQQVTTRDFMSCHTFDVRDRLAEITTPALAVVGEHDSMTPPDYHEYLASELPDCEYTVVENCAHLAMLEQPAAFNAALAAFTERL